MNGQAASFDFENHLVALGSVASYAYDADGNRSSTYVSSNNPTTTSYVVDTSLPYGSVVEEYSGSTLANGTLAARYDYGDDLVRMDRGGVYYYLFDGLGSTRQLVNTGGAVTDTWAYSAFGELANRTGSTQNPFLFNAQQFDTASGDYYLQARYYDQSNGRFISQDPYSGSNEDPITLHRYLYASNDPVDRVDPSGQYDLPSFGAVLGGVATLAGIAFGAYNFIENPTTGNGALLALSVIPGEGLLSVVGRLAEIAKVGKLAMVLNLGIKDALSFASGEMHMVNYLRNVRGVSHILFNERSLEALRDAVYGNIQGKRVLDGIGFLKSTGKTILAEAKPQINGSDLLKTKEKFESTYELLKEAAAREGQNFGVEEIDELVVVYKSKSGLSVNAKEFEEYGKATLDGVEKEIKYIYYP